MKWFTLTFLLFMFVLLTGTDQSAQVRCVTCPDSLASPTVLLINQAVKSAAKPYRDTLLKRLSQVIERQDSICKAIDSIKPDTSIRRERYRLLNGEWVYDWYYVDGRFIKLVKNRL